MGYNNNMKYFITLFLAITSLNCFADEGSISLFPLLHYDQHVSTWIKESDADFDKSLLSPETQQKHLELFYNHYFGSASPWSREYVTQILNQAPPENLPTIEQSVLNHFNNKAKPNDKIGYGANFRPYSDAWIVALTKNIDIEQLGHLSYSANHRAIAIDNLAARVLPTHEVHFFSYKLAGQGYPFDNLQMSALWAGTPLYVLTTTRDHAWSLVLAPDIVAWVPSNGIAYVSVDFVNTWSAAAKNKMLAITRTQKSLLDAEGNYLFSAYVGMVFPGVGDGDDFTLWVPVADGNHHALIKKVAISSDAATIMPLRATPQHFSFLMNTLISRPYGWGGMYFYNDCSAELKSLFTPFGIWLPRHSSYQVNAGKMVDMSYAAPEKRLAYLMEQGQRFVTIVYIGGHVMLYMGNYSNPDDGKTQTAMTYQNIWGLSPTPPTRRAVIGQSVFLPLLLQYPEDGSLVSLANKKFFQVSFLNQLPAADSLLRVKRIDMKALMYFDQDE
jgi:hypothetical protein